MKPNIVFFDIETSPLEITKFQYDRNPFINYKTIKKDWYIICASWRFLGSKTVHSVKIDTLGDDKKVVQTLRDVLAKADVIAGHVIDRFDLRGLTARMVYHNIAPLPNIPTVDTFKMAKKIGGFTSNKLDYLAQYFGLPRKIQVDGELWNQVMAGSKTALDKMVAYNKQDVSCNIGVYERLLPYMKNHPHIGVMTGKDRNCSCANCGSDKIKFNGVRITAAGIKKQEIQCQNCGSYSRIPYKQ